MDVKVRHRVAVHERVDVRGVHRLRQHACEAATEHAKRRCLVVA